ncbi:hypothetical protein IW140_005160 [Coemansia sp. RSA 1813]|nr:hypothetical protein EV178_005137 [Coemansia sp. RSA 1646]KAJ1768104.1 hypothetical protein LPJ74_005002 [Coemansia sp. RSA 1843]KAJ2088039.1 hypothetical protein IW138_004548 [Coemansia sp. RSA 986]KAJ2211944.1 hypothetical protein EV179_005050 [Coemansia sp. RSA 487]KAJ2565877.1 hypothetical protein IW140_005160 [Coemansia sp. RSA 1813]
MSCEDQRETQSASPRPSRSRPRSRPHVEDNVYVEITRPIYKRRRQTTESDICTAVPKGSVGEALVVSWAQGLAATGRTAEEEEVRLVCELAGVEKSTVCRLVASRVGARLKRVVRDSDTWKVVRIPEALQSTASAVELPSDELADIVSSLASFLVEYKRQLGRIKGRTEERTEERTDKRAEERTDGRIEEKRASESGTIDDNEVSMAEEGGNEIDVGIDLDNIVVDSRRISNSAIESNMAIENSVSSSNSFVDIIDNNSANNSVIDNSQGEGADSNLAESADNSQGEIADNRKNKRGAKEVKKTDDGVVFGEMINKNDYSPALVAIAGKDFEPMAVQCTEELPAHCVVRIRSGNQKQGKHEYEMNGVPRPVDPDLWLAQVKAIYSGPGVCIVNRIQHTACQSERVMGLFVCIGCLRRKAEDICRFRGVRMLTELTIELSDKCVATRFLLVPALISQPKAPPQSVNITDLGASCDDPRTFTGTQWIEFYMIHAAAAGLVDELSYALRTVTAEDPPPSKTIEYGTHPQLGCSAAPCVLRRAAAGSRQLCDMCAASILCAYYTCAMCAMEVCLRCFAEWDDSLIGTRTSSSLKMWNALPRIVRCKRIGRSGGSSALSAIHCRSQFVRVSTVAAAAMRAVDVKARTVLDLGAALGSPDTFDCGGIDDGVLSASLGTRIANIEQRAGGLNEWELPVAYVTPDELSTREFSQLWRRGVVIVVRDLLPAMDPGLWRPEWWIRNAGDHLVSVWDCASGAAMGEAWPLRDFFRLFDGEDTYAHVFEELLAKEGERKEGEKEADVAVGEKEADAASKKEVDAEGKGETNDEGETSLAVKKKKAVDKWPRHAREVGKRILKLKDWPTADDFATVLPSHFERLMSALPFPDYTRRDGRLNMAARLPPDHVPPDLGPKMYCAYASSDAAGGVGTTNLHCDAADAVNIMAYAAPLAEEAPAAAVWDIYPPEAAAAIRTFIGPPAKGDPIHNQETYLTCPDRERLYREYGVRCYRIYQNPGDAVFVPAGCAHQVCNYANAVKVAMDFVSPERINHCHRLSADFRALPSTHPRSTDLLQLNSILWWALVKGSCAAPPT